MSAYSRATLPQNFYDKTSDMLLAQPEPQYLYAQMFLGALGASLQVPGELGLPGRAIGGAGAAYSSEDRDRLALSNPVMTQVIAAVANFNAEPGNTLKFNRPVFTDSTYTETSRRIASGTTISQDPVTVSSQQTSLTLHRYGGPYSGGAVKPYGIEAFDANMGVHKAASMHGTHLKRDFDKFIDAVQVSLLNLGATTVYPEGMTADNDATVAGMFPFTLQQLRSTKRQMDVANLPTFGDGYRAMVLNPQQLEQLGADPEYQRSAKEFAEYSILFPGYVKSVSKFHIFESNTLTSTANSSSVDIHTGHAIAPGALLGGMGRAPKICPNTNDNYGETALVIWLADLAFGLANNSFCYLVKSSA